MPSLGVRVFCVAVCVAASDQAISQGPSVEAVQAGLRGYQQQSTGQGDIRLVADTREIGDQPPPATSPATQPAVSESLPGEIPDPTVDRKHLTRRLEEYLREPGITDLKPDRKTEIYNHTLELLDSIRRPKQVRLALAEAIHRTLASSFAIHAEGYGPAIQTARIVEAEAQFDAAFFSNFTFNKQDRPSASELQATDLDARRFESGIRKLLSTGTQVQASYALERTETNLVFQTLNPQYFNQFIVELRHPLLQGFGLDFNRAQIEIRKNDRRISLSRFEQQVRDTLQKVEEAYWRLVQARRTVSISAALLVDTKRLVDFYEARLGLDVFKAQVDQILAQYETRLADFVTARNNVGNAEDLLKSLINDPELNLAENVEIVPVDVPFHEPIVIDSQAEQQAALYHRSELREGKLQIENAKILTGVAKNQALPRLDVIFRYMVDGLGASPHSAFSQLSMNDFHEYMLMLEFEWPIGNRAARAALRQAILQHRQASYAYKALIEQVLNEVSLAVRQLRSSYDRIGPRLEATLAQSSFLRAVRSRAKTKGPVDVDLELRTQEGLFAARQAFLEALIDYNLSIVNLERAKGTLLEYNNVHLSEAALPD